jgi:hypothetical protein
MKTVTADSGNWHIQCIPGDGARISELRYSGYDLLTSNPPLFNPPVKNYGEYETRPVYGYDDCFPSVDPCIYPENKFKIRDHGELCWHEWTVHLKDNCLICSTECLRPKVKFTRKMEFSDNMLKWRFRVYNRSDEKISFLHVMHALFPLKKIDYIKLPDCKKIIDEVNSIVFDVKNSDELSDNLFYTRSGHFKMMLQREITDGLISIGLENGITLKIGFDKSMFPTLGIWWNNSGYPEANGPNRSECAFEPIPGTCSDLSKSYNDGCCLSLEPGKSLSWTITWTIDANLTLLS